MNRITILCIGIGLTATAAAVEPQPLLPLPAGCSWLSWDHKIILCRQAFKPGQSLCPEGFRRTCPRLPNSLKALCDSDLGGFFAFTSIAPIGHIPSDPPGVVRCTSGTDGFAVTGCGTLTGSNPTATFFGGSCNGYPRAVMCGDDPSAWKCTSWGGFDKVENPNPNDGILCCK